MASQKTLDDLFLDGLKDIYYAEKQILKALPKMARAAQLEEAKQGFLQHRDETQGQIERRKPRKSSNPSRIRRRSMRA
jgi:ferritin-like metal-binding protein YciE